MNALWICCVITLLNMSAASSCMWKAIDSAALKLDCSGLSLNSLPTQLLNSSIKQLDLSQNNLITLDHSSFAPCEHVEYLNLSSSKIAHISKDAFMGLANLAILDLTNNPFLKKAVPDGLFNDCSSLKKLYISGYPFNFDTLGALSNLHEVVLSPSKTHMPYALATLPKLRVLTFWNSPHFGSNLTRNLIQPFLDSNIEEFGFVKLHLRNIENGTFSDFTSLKLLNFAGNTELPVDDVINAISTSQNTTITSLVMDLVSSKITDNLVKLGQYDKPCRSAWLNLEKLSMRAINIMGINSEFLQCLANIKAVSIGMNNLHFTDKQYDMVSLVQFLNHLESVDGSYLMPINPHQSRLLVGYMSKSSWLPENNEFFPRVYNNTHEVETTDVVGGTCPTPPRCFSLPIKISLQYLRFDQTVHFASNSVHGCYHLPNNDLRFVNLSNIYTNKPVTFNATLLGFKRLEILDFTRSNLYSFNIGTLCHMPSLRTLKLGGNRLGQFGAKTLEVFPHVPQLSSLDLRENTIHQLRENTFKQLPNLEYLYLGGNMLRNASFIGADLKSLRRLDLSNNKLARLSQQVTQHLENMFGGDPDFVLDISDNPLQCDCNDLDFIEWLHSTGIRINARDQLMCQGQASEGRILDVNVADLRARCGGRNNQTVLFSIIIAVVIAIVIVSMVTYRYRWHIKLHIYQWKCCKRDLIRPDPPSLQHGKNNYVTITKDKGDVCSSVHA